MIRWGAALSVLWGLAVPGVHAAASTGVQAAPSLASITQVYDFDIPSLPLVQALDRYAMLTHRPALFSSDVVTGRTSTAVRGRYSPEAALRLMLKGTGLTADVAAGGPADAFILKQETSGRPAPPAAALANGYAGLLQARLWRALCRDERARPGDYRILLRFDVDRTGALQKVRLLGSTGDARRDEAVRAVASQTRVGEPPPANLPQPVTMLIQPDALAPGGGSPHCAMETG